MRKMRLGSLARFLVPLPLVRDSLVRIDSSQRAGASSPRIFCSIGATTSQTAPRAYDKRPGPAQLTA
jgi:hypothetical protein